MRGLSLWQPWASAVAVGAKAVETRSWPTPYRGEVAIQAAKKWNAEIREAAMRFRDLGVGLPSRLPRGEVVCLAELVDCVRMTEELIAQQTELEIAMGAWLPGRWAWILRNVRPLKRPVELRGYQGLWNLKGEQERKIMEQVK